MVCSHSGGNRDSISQLSQGRNSEMKKTSKNGIEHPKMSVTSLIVDNRYQKKTQGLKKSVREVGSKFRDRDKSMRIVDDDKFIDTEELPSRRGTEACENAEMIVNPTFVSTQPLES